MTAIIDLSLQSVPTPFKPQSVIVTNPVDRAGPSYIQNSHKCYSGLLDGCVIEARIEDA